MVVCAITAHPGSESDPAGRIYAFADYKSRGDLHQPACYGEPSGQEPAGRLRPGAGVGSFRGNRRGKAIHRPFQSGRPASRVALHMGRIGSARCEAGTKRVERKLVEGFRCSGRDVAAARQHNLPGAIDHDAEPPLPSGAGNLSGKPRATSRVVNAHARGGGLCETVRLAGRPALNALCERGVRCL